VADCEAGLADLAEALALNPKSIPALQLKARVYSVNGKNRDGVAVLTELLRHHPEWLDALSGRAVLYARLGERGRAHADAEQALRIGEWRPVVAYQLAGVYATTSKSHPEDKREALRLLASALRDGFGYELLEDDRELDPVRSGADFSAVVEESKKAFERRAKE
jgi:eukaryotic-like serine/threonine-protein kinase